MAKQPPRPWPVRATGPRLRSAVRADGGPAAKRHRGLRSRHKEGRAVVLPRRFRGRGRLREPHLDNADTLRMTGREPGCLSNGVRFPGKLATGTSRDGRAAPGSRELRPGVTGRGRGCEADDRHGTRRQVRHRRAGPETQPPEDDAGRCRERCGAVPRHTAGRGGGCCILISQVGPVTGRRSCKCIGQSTGQPQPAAPNCLSLPARWGRTAAGPRPCSRRSPPGPRPKAASRRRSARPRRSRWGNARG